MAITRILQTGFENANDEKTAIFPNSIDTTPVTVFELGENTGSFYLNAGQSLYEGIYTDALGSAIAQCRVGFLFNGQTIGTGSSILIAGFCKTDNTNEIISLYYDEDNKRFELLAGATSLGTYSIDLSAITRNWMHIGIDAKIDGAAGWANVYLNGEAVITFSGDTNDGGTDLDVLIIGSNTAGVNWTNCSYDDVYWDETTGEGSAAQCPKYCFYKVYPNGNGNYSQWDGSDGNQVNNYQLVDEAGLSSTDYVESQAAAEFDSYALTAAPADDVNTVSAVIPWAYAIDDGAGAPDSLSLGTRLSSTNLMGADIALPTSYGIVFERQTTKPGGGAWTTTDIDSTEVVLESA